MSERKASRANVVDLHSPVELRTWLDVKKALPHVKGLSKRQRADYISALNTVGNMHRLPGEKPKDVDQALSRLDVDRRRLPKYLDRTLAARKGLTNRDSYNNLTYRVRKAFEVTGVAQRIDSGAWPIDDQRYPRLSNWHQAALATFMRWRERERIPLEAVTSQHVEQFGVWLESDPNRKCPRDTLLATARALNDAATEFSEFWPPTFVTVAHKFSDRYFLEEPAFALSFYEEMRLRTVIVTDPPLDDPDARPAIKCHVAKAQEYEIQRLASALVAQTGRDPKTITCIADLVEFDAFTSILQFLLGRVRKKNPNATTSGGLYITAQFLCNLAKNWVKVDPQHLRRLQAIAQRRDPNPAARGKGQRKVRRTMTRKNRETLSHFRDPQILGRFLDLPAVIFKRILKRLKKYGRLKRKDAVLLGWAFAVSLLQVAPVRPKNGSGIELGRNLIELGAGASRRVFVHWAPEEVKNDTELEFELTGEVLELFDLYMQHARPLLCGPTNRYLFPGRGDGPKQTSWFSTQIAQNLENELGVRVTGHQFRHLIGLIYLLEHSGDNETVRQFLGHADVSTTDAFYVGIEMKDAARALDATIKKRRAELAAKAQRGLRRSGRA